MSLRPSSFDEFYLDPRAVRRSFDAASATYDAAAVVSAQIRSRLLERLDIVRIAPTLVLDLGAGTGVASRALKQRYPAARVVAVDSSLRMMHEARRHQGFLRRFERLVADASSLPFPESSADLVFSNLMLHWCNDPDRVFFEIRRVLKPDALLTFTTLGPDTLRELRDAWRQVDARTHVNRFIDMHDLGDALMRAGFAEPVMDTEWLSVTYANVDALMQDLKRTGARNWNRGRPRGLTGRQALNQLRARLDATKQEGVLRATVEVVYGHAWAGGRPPRAAGGVVKIPVHRIGHRA